MFTFLARYFRRKADNEPITIALPDPLTMIYGTFFRAAPDEELSSESLLEEVEAWLDRLDEPFGPALKEWIAKGLLMVHVSRGDDAPPAPVSLLQAMGMGEEEEKRFNESTHVAIFSSPDRLQAPRFGLWSGLTAARAIADLRDGVVIDVAVPRLLRDRPTHEEFDGGFDIVMPQHLVVPFSRDRRGLCWMTTKGMSKFGLPELEMIDVPPNLPDSLVPFINGLALVLVNASMASFSADTETDKTFKIGPEFRLSTRQISEAHGEEFSGPPAGVRGWTTVRLEFRPGKRGGESFLRIGPPRHFNEGRGVWLNSMLVDLWGVKREIRQVENDDEAMAEAHTKALATLPQFKKRFQKGPELGQLYYVKHGFPRSDDAHNEFMWVVVKTWYGDRIEGILANDPSHRIDLRLGQSIKLSDSEVFDWLLTLPDGTQEGGFTNIAASERGRPDDENDDDEPDAN